MDSWRIINLNRGRLIYYKGKFESYPMNHDATSRYWVVKLTIGKYEDRFVMQRSQMNNEELAIEMALTSLFQNYEAEKGLPTFSMHWLSDKDYFDICAKHKPERRPYEV